LLHSHIVITDPKLRQTYDDFIQTVDHTATNILGAAATQAGYEAGEPWLNQILQIVQSNYDYVCQQLSKQAPEIEIAKLEGSYLLFLDFSQYLQADEIETFIQEKCRLAVDYGSWFGENFACCIRLNL